MEATSAARASAMWACGGGRGEVGEGRDGGVEVWRGEVVVEGVEEDIFVAIFGICCSWINDGLGLFSRVGDFCLMRWTKKLRKRRRVSNTVDTRSHEEELKIRRNVFEQVTRSTPPAFFYGSVI